MQQRSLLAIAISLVGLLTTSCSCQPPAGSCADDDQCPAGYLCLNGQCHLAIVVDGGRDGAYVDRGVSEGSVLDLASGDHQIEDRLTPDHQAIEASQVDSALPDAATVDAWPGDRPPLEAGGGDLVLVDGPHTDLASADHVPPDGPATDTTALDAAFPEASVIEASVVEASLNEASVADAGGNEASTSDGSVPVDGGPGPGEPCGTVGAFTDHFTQGLSDIWAQGTVSSGDIVPIADNGTLRFVVPEGATARWGRVQTWTRASLRGGRLAVRVAGTDFAGDVNARTYLEFGVDDDNQVVVLLEGGTLWAESSTTQSARQRREIGAFELDRHRWWSLRGDGDRVHVEFSGDGQHWSADHEFSALPFVERGHVALGAGTSGNPANLRTAYIAFDDLNLDPGRVAVPWCLASSVSEDFSTLDLETRWRVSRETPTACAVDALGGQLTVSIPAGQSTRCSLASTTAYDLRYDSIHVRAINFPSGMLVGLFLSSPQHDLEFGFDATSAVFWDRDGGQATVGREGADTLHVFHDGRDLIFSIGTASGPSRKVFSLPTDQVRGMQIDLGVRPHGQPTTDVLTVVRLDDYNHR